MRAEGRMTARGRMHRTALKVIPALKKATSCAAAVPLSLRGAERWPGLTRPSNPRRCRATTPEVASPGLRRRMLRLALSGRTDASRAGFMIHRQRELVLTASRKTMLHFGLRVECDR